MANLKDDAICIRQWDWSETSQTVSLFTREHGIVRGIAKGSRREKSPFCGGIELASRGEIVAIVKTHHAAGGLATLTSWDLHETFPAVRTSHLGFRIAMGILDSIGRSMREADPHPGLFEGSVQSLRALEGSAADQYAALVAFLLLLLKETGHAPELNLDVRSGLPLVSSPVLGFSPSRGGVTASSGVDDGLPDVWRVRSETIDALRLISQRATQRHTLPESTLKRGAGLLAAYLRHVIESDIPALSSLQVNDSPDRGQ